MLTLNSLEFLRCLRMDFKDIIELIRREKRDRESNSGIFASALFLQLMRISLESSKSKESAA